MHESSKRQIGRQTDRRGERRWNTATGTDRETKTERDTEMKLFLYYRLLLLEFTALRGNEGREGGLGGAMS